MEFGNIIVADTDGNIGDDRLIRIVNNGRNVACVMNSETLA